MKMILSLSLALLALPPFAHADEDRDYDRNVLLFTGEVRNFLDQAEELYELHKLESEGDNDQLLEKKLDDLSLTAIRISESYFQLLDDSNRAEMTTFLTRSLSENEHLQNYFLFLGNGFNYEAERLVRAREVNMTRILIGGSVAGLALGAGGGYMVYRLQYLGAGTQTQRMLRGAVTGLAIAAVVSGGAYGARYVIPVNLAVRNSKDFLARYPSGKDFIDDVIQSPDMALLEEALLEGDE
jgi:hypothetical protein